MEDAQKVSLTAFVAARLDEDEATAKAAVSVAGPDWHYGHFWPEDGSTATTMILSAAGSPLADTLHRDDEEMAPFIARHDPARVLREIEAGRKTLALYECAKAELSDSPGDPKVFGWARAAEVAVLDRAAVWRDHPHYDPGWTP